MGVDIGGTFTDIAVGQNDGALLVSQTLSTPGDHSATYDYASDDELELVNLRLVATGRRPGGLDFQSLSAATRRSESGTRPMAFERGAQPVDSPVIGRDEVDGRTRPGPVIVESDDSTVVVPPGAEITRDAHANLVITLRP